MHVVVDTDGTQISALLRQTFLVSLNLQVLHVFPFLKAEGLESETISQRALEFHVSMLALRRFLLTTVIYFVYEGVLEATNILIEI